MRWLRKGADAVGVALFSTLFLVFMVQIVARFVFNRPLPWTDEAAVVLYVWVILWAAAVNSGVAPGPKDRLLPTHFLLAGDFFAL